MTLQPSMRAPQFSGTAVMPDGGSFKEIRLDDFRGKYLVLLFYPADFTFVCPTEVIAFSDRIDELRKLDCEVVAVSTDSEHAHLAWTRTPRDKGGLGPMNIPLLADRTQAICRAYGCLKEEAGISYRALYVIDDKGVLRNITMNDLPVGRSVDETVRLVQAFRFTDEHGEVCPAGWKPGKKTMKPTAEGVAKYLAEANHQ